jgi:hypothetical protein
MDRQGRSRSAHRRRRTLAGRACAARRDRREVRQCHRSRARASQEEPTERRAASEVAAVGAGVLRLLRRSLLAARRRPLRLLEPYQQGFLLQQPRHRARRFGAACACRAEGPDDGAGDRRGRHARLYGRDEPAEQGTPLERRFLESRTGEGREADRADRRGHCGWHVSSVDEGEDDRAGSAQGGTDRPARRCAGGHAGHSAECVGHLREEDRGAHQGPQPEGRTAGSVPGFARPDREDCADSRPGTRGTLRHAARRTAHDPRMDGAASHWKGV